MIYVGIDEAGRGPIVGPLVVAGVATDEPGLNKLKMLGVKDSKALDKAKREKLFDLILKEVIHSVIVKVPPRLIDYVNLNVVERNTICFIVERISAIVKPDIIIIDLVGDPRRIEALVKRVAPNAKVVAEPKADAKYHVVAAASIVAKVVRDREIELLRRRFGFKGSGYPGDRETIEWIKEVYAKMPDNPPPFIRLSWSTLKRVAPRWYRGKGVGIQKRLTDFLDT